VRKLLIPILLIAVVLIPAGAVRAGASGAQPGIRKVTVPEADRFVPYAKTIHVGDTVRWTNNDADDHTVVSDDAFNSAGHQGTDTLLPAGGTVELTFDQPGTFVYYCRFHARLDSYNQPVAPGPDGGIEGAAGNFGTPMSGVIVVLP
jgi:plastocyanin